MLEITSSDNLGTFKPFSSHKSDATTPHPPPKVKRPTLLPLGSGNEENAAEKSSKSIGISACTIPAWRQAAINTFTSEAIAPVWLAAALAPADVRPPFKTITGFLLPTRFADSKNLRPFFIL